MSADIEKESRGQLRILKAAMKDMLFAFWELSCSSGFNAKLARPVGF